MEIKRYWSTATIEFEDNMVEDTRIYKCHLCGLTPLTLRQLGEHAGAKSDECMGLMKPYHFGWFQRLLSFLRADKWF